MTKLLQTFFLPTRPFSTYLTGCSTFFKKILCIVCVGKTLKRWK